MTRARDLASMLHSDGSLNIATSVNLGDNEKVYFGDANDLVIFHNASKSIIEDVGTGNLEVRGTNIEFLDGTGSEYYLTMANNGSVGLYWDGNLKLSTTSTGVDVSGEVTATGYFRIPNNQQGGFFDVAGNNGITLVGSTGSPASTIIAYAGGSERLRIDSSGNVGIGTASPTGFSGYTSLDINNATNGAIIDLSQGNSMKGRLIATASTMAIETSSSVPIIFQPTGTEAMRISADGNVGIGQSNPTSPNGATDFLHIGNSSNQDTSIVLQDAVEIWEIYNNDDLLFNFDTTNVMTLQRVTGNVGIGTASPSAVLDIESTSATQLELKRSGTAGQIAAMIFKDGGDAQNRISSTSSNLVFGYGGSNTEAMRIDSSGNVGIGTSNPTVPLDVTTAGGGNWIAKFQNNSTGSSYGVSISEPSGATAGYPLLRVGQGFSPYSDWLRVDTSGNTAFGATPSTGARVHIETTSQDKAGLRIKRSFYNWFQWGTSPPSPYLHIKTGLPSGSGGNTHPTMSLFHIKGYTYSSETIDTMIGFHNWSGSIYSLRITNNGSRAAGLNPYASSDGYVVLVISTGTNYPGITIDWHQAFQYGFVNVGVLSYTSSASTSGVY